MSGMFLSLTYNLVLDLTSPLPATTNLSETERTASPLGRSRFQLAYVLETPTRCTRALGMEEDSWEHLR